MAHPKNPIKKLAVYNESTRVQKKGYHERQTDRQTDTGDGGSKNITI